MKDGLTDCWISEIAWASVLLRPFLTGETQEPPDLELARGERVGRH